MRVGINLFDFWSPGSRGEGVLNYVRGLVEGLAQVDHENEYVLFLNSLNHDEFSHLPARFKGIVATLDRATLESGPVGAGPSTSEL